MSNDPPLPPPEVLLEHASWLRRLAGELLRDPSSAEDIAQETWLAYLQNRPDRDRPLRPWLARVVRNRAAMRLRGNANRRAREVEAARAEATPSSDRLVERAEVQRRLVDAVLALENPYRETLLLRYYEGLTPKQIAEVRGIAPATVRTHLFRGHARLREVLDEQHGGDRTAWSALLLPLVRPGRAAPAALAGLGPAPLLLVLGVVAALTAGAFLLRPLLSRNADPAQALHLDSAAAEAGASSTQVHAPDRTARAPVASTAAGARLVRLVDASTGRPLPSFRVDVDGEVRRTDARGLVRLPADAREVVLVDDERLAVDAVVQHGTRVVRPVMRQVLGAEDLWLEIDPEDAATPGAATLRVAAGPTLRLSFEAEARVDLSRLEAQLVADGLSPYLDDGLPRQVAPLRPGDELVAEGAEACDAWVRFAAPPAGASDPRASWRLVVRDRDGLLHGEAPVELGASPDGRPPLDLELERSARVDGSLESTGSTEGVELRLHGVGDVLVAGTHADADGRFVLRWIAPGDYTLRAESPGHRSVERAITLHGGERLGVDLALEPLSPGGRIAGSVRSESGAYDGQLLVFLLDEGDRVLGVYPTTWREQQGELCAPFEFDEAPGGALRLDVVSLSDSVTYVASPAPLEAPCSTVDVLLLDRVPRGDVAFRARDADTGASLDAFEVDVEVHGAVRRFLASGTADARKWTLVVGGMRWNDFEGPAPLRSLPLDAEVAWTVRAEGYAPSSGRLTAGLPQEGRVVDAALKPR